MWTISQLLTISVCVIATSIFCPNGLTIFVSAVGQPSSPPFPSSPSSSSSSPSSPSSLPSSSSIVNEIQANKPLELPRIIEHPLDIVVKKNEPAMLYCKADGQPKPTIEWYKDGEKIRSNRPRIFLSGDGLFFYKVSSEGKESDTGTYWCVARNSVGKVISRNATVNVGYLRDEFRLSPKSGTVVAGDSVTLDCSPPRGSPEPTVTWKKDGEPMTLASPRFQLTTSGSLKINDIHPTDRGIYICVASSSVGSRESTPASLVVLVKPYFIKLPNNITVAESSSIELECKVDGDPVPLITWIKKDGQLPSQRSTIGPDKTLSIINVTSEDEGVYTCEAGNLVGSATASATLSVNSYSSGLIISSPTLYHSIAKEPYFIVGAILLMFLLCSIIMIIFARQHLGWKKAVGAYITVQLSKNDQLEKSRHLDTCSSKNSWLLETTTGGPTLGQTITTSPEITTTGLLGNKGSTYHQHHHSSNSPATSSNKSSVRMREANKPFNPHHDTHHDHDYDDHNEGYYAEVEGYSSLVTFGKKDSLTKSSNGSKIIQSMAPSIEPYATTNLINTYHHSSHPNPNINPNLNQYLESSINERRTCDQTQSAAYYGLPLSLSINQSTASAIANSPSLSRYPHYQYQQQHINNYHSPSSSNRSTTTNTSSTSTPNTGLGYRKVILKDARSKDHNNRAVLISDDLYAIPNCGLDIDDVRPPSANFFLPKT
ncbi:hemicentin-2 [Tetranychus urticae]|uniref:hemicentin-2 n=1 Tax=Tetranychus urticae TaxID=32264 RepID=UPI00077BFD1E|nr:hemicentin-2 [Tetranychus urticae]